MQRFVLVVAALAVVIGASKQAKAFGVGADFGYSRVLVKQGDDFNGYGGDLYIRPLPLPIVDPEIQVGWHHFSANGGDTSFTVYPLLAGARLDLPVIPVFVGAHLGVIGNHIKATTGPSATDAFTNTNWDFGFNVGGGWHFLSLPLIKLGIGAWYYVVPKNHSGSSGSAGSPDFNMFQVALDVGLGF
jgi:opacity protein-like surface antigen